MEMLGGKAYFEVLGKAREGARSSRGVDGLEAGWEVLRFSEQVRLTM